MAHISCSFFVYLLSNFWDYFITPLPAFLLRLKKNRTKTFPRIMLRLDPASNESGIEMDVEKWL